jgi:large subunit ribosomal protein L18e
MKVRDKNPVKGGLINELQEKGLKTPVWKAVAKGLNRPSRKAYEMNVSRLEKHAKKGESVVVPGTVMGSGDLTKPLTVAAFRFSGAACEKIEKAGGKCMSIEDMVKDNPNGKKLRVMG